MHTSQPTFLAALITFLAPLIAAALLLLPATALAATYNQGEYCVLFPKDPPPGMEALGLRYDYRYIMTSGNGKYSLQDDHSATYGDRFADDYRDGAPYVKYKQNFWYTNFCRYMYSVAPKLKEYLSRQPILIKHLPRVVTDPNASVRVSNFHATLELNGTIIKCPATNHLNGAPFMNVVRYVPEEDRLICVRK